VTMAFGGERRKVKKMVNGVALEPTQIYSDTVSVQRDGVRCRRVVDTPQLPSPKDDLVPTW